MELAGKKPRIVLTNFLTAIAISLVVNFFYFVSIIVATSTYSANSQPMWHSPHLQSWYITLQILYFILLAFILLTICTTRMRAKSNKSGFIWRLIVCLSIAIIFFFIAPRLTRGGTLLQLNFHRPVHRIFDVTLFLQCSLTLVVALLYGKIFDLIYQKQNIMLENEVLKNETLQATYNSLVNQTNPHFFFNSLNSLAMLVREKHNGKALEYIERLSDSFRYILQNSQIEMTTLEEELKFLDAYAYMLDIRYDGKIFFTIEVDEKYKQWRLPTLSIQPLIENAVKHNSITKSNPLTIRIKTIDNSVVVSNPITPKIDKDHGTGIGLNNLCARYLLLTSKEVVINNNGEVFEVVLPLTSVR